MLPLRFPSFFFADFFCRCSRITGISWVDITGSVKLFTVFVNNFFPTVPTDFFCLVFRIHQRDQLSANFCITLSISFLISITFVSQIKWQVSCSTVKIRRRPARTMKRGICSEVCLLCLFITSPDGGGYSLCVISSSVVLIILEK